MLRKLKATHSQRQFGLLYPCVRQTLPRVACRPIPNFSQTRSATIAQPFRRQAELPGDYEQSQLPRYLRRESHHSPSSSVATTERRPSRKQTKHGASPTSISRKSDYRSRHFDPSHEEKPRSEIRLLEPHVLSARLKKLCDTGQVDGAVSMLKNAPLDAQNTPVWNTLIWECMKAKRFKLAYQLFIDVNVILQTGFCLLINKMSR